MLSPTYRLVLVLALALGCANRALHEEQKADAPDAAGVAGTSGAAGAAEHDTCGSDADCPPCASASSARECLAPGDVALVHQVICARGSDGFHHCTSRTHPQVSACPAPEDGTCCSGDADCPTGEVCLSLSGVQIRRCGGIPALGTNQCVADECHADADCTAEANGACTAGYPRLCAYGPCRTNADCTMGPAGVCVVEVLEIIQGCLFPEVFCRYANDPCRTNTDCPDAEVCAPRGLPGTVCVVPPEPSP